MRIVTARRGIPIIVVLLCALFVFAANAGRALVVNAPKPADVILVLAGETDHRPARAIQLLEQGYAQRIVLDVPADAKIFDSTEIQLAEKYVARLPQAAAVQICPIVGLSTRDESHDAEQCLAHEEGNRILIVTSDYHTRRALSIFRHEVHGKSFSIAAAYDDTQFGTRWWTHRQWAKTFYEEWLRLAWWNAVDRWR
jgi:uncharacterized SAM-binding protein YcdF (DUF218 family)